MTEAELKMLEHQTKVEKVDFVLDATPESADWMRIEESPMTENLGPLRASRRSGQETFHHGAESLGFQLSDFWAWSVSDLVSNATRGRLAEYIIARALGISTAGVRNEWAAYDLVTPSGIRIEVKSAAYLQAWFQRKLSTISFSTRPSRAWDPETGVLSEEVTHQAEVYVFALLAHVDKPTIDPLDLAQWTFLVLPTKVISARTRSQHSITLNTLDGLTQRVSFKDLALSVEAAGHSARSA